jgi:DNA primase
LQFKKSLFLYNGWSIARRVRDLIVVEGFPATWWLWQNGVSAVVALMGSSCSKEQGELIVKLVEPTGSLWVFTDGDDAGRRCAASVFFHVGPHRFTRLVPCDEGQQPTDWTPEEILGSFGAEKSDQSDEPTGATLCERSTDETHEPTAAQE